MNREELQRSLQSLHHFLQARYEILRSCLAELQRVGILAQNSAAPLPYPMTSHMSMVRRETYNMHAVPHETCQALGLF